MGVGRTVIFTEEVTALHGDIPVLVRFITAFPEKPTGGAQVAFRVEGLGVNVPPAVVVHVAPVAAPPMLPLS